jgi:hypothetical protein
MLSAQANRGISLTQLLSVTGEGHCRTTTVNSASILFRELLSSLKKIHILLDSSCVKCAYDEGFEWVTIRLALAGWPISH